jgi:hypothetical protein
MRLVRGRRRKARFETLTLVGQWREWDLERDNGDPEVRFQGWVFRDPETGTAIPYGDDGVEVAGAVVVRAAGVSYREDALQEDAFRPGQPLELTPEPWNPHDRNAVAIWDAAHRHQVGYVPRDLAPYIAGRFRRGDRLRAMCLAEFVHRSGKRCGLRVLIAPATLRLDLEDSVQTGHHQ